MPSSLTSHLSTLPDSLPTVAGRINYLAPADGPLQVRNYPPSSGRAMVVPANDPRVMSISDVRPVVDRLRLDVHGFEHHAHATAFADFYDAAAVRERYYPEVEGVVKALTGALAVFAFDHNVRSSVRANRGEPGVRRPVDQVHNDYTEASGARRRDEVLAAAGRPDLADRRVALVNLWRPIVGPIVDNAFALCDPQSFSPSDLLVTEILHFGEGDLETPRHAGQIFGMRHGPTHRWLYVSEMRPDEILLLKCYDSGTDGRSRFTPHTGFDHPDCPAEFVPRESLEVRTLVVFDEPR